MLNQMQLCTDKNILHVQCITQNPTRRVEVNLRRAWGPDSVGLRRHRRSRPASLCQQTVATVSAPAVPSQPSKLPQDPSCLEGKLPDNLQKYVAELKLSTPRGLARLCILGASHVSRQSCNEAAQLIASVKPEVVFLELCKDRVDFLADPSVRPQHWHSRNIAIQGISAQKRSSTANACTLLLSRLRCQTGRAFTAYEIEQDCVQLLSSGLFGAITPITRPSSASDAPMFLYSDSKVSALLSILSSICHLMCHPSTVKVFRWHTYTCWSN